MNKFIFGNFVYEYRLIRQVRKTVSLTVTPELQIILKCPMDANADRIEKFLKKKWFWLEKQLSFFKKYQRKVYKKEYISGEGYLYLGRQYKLIVKRAKEDGVSVVKGRLIVSTIKLVSNAHYNKKLIENWFILKTESIFKARFIEMLSRFDYKVVPVLSVREMKTRWGSFLSNGKILLNPKLIHTPKECIDYVIVHELCHFQYSRHDRNFFILLEKKYPKWNKIKDKLEMYLIN